MRRIILDNLDFFSGERVYRVVRNLHRGKAQLKWSVIERWEERLGRSLNCGMERTYTLKKLLGVSLIEREDFESTIATSIGTKWILEAKSEVKSKLGRELRLEETQEEEEEFHFQAPKCGRVTLRVYQFMRLHEISYKDNRFWLWRNDNFSKTITEWVNYLYDNSVVIDIDPACNCKDGLDNEIEGLARLSVGDIAMLVAYKHSEGGLEFPGLNVIFPDKRIEEMFFRPFTFDAAIIPSHLRFLAGEHSSILTGHFQPYGGDLSPSKGAADFQAQQTPRNAYRKREIQRTPDRANDSQNVLYLLFGGIVGAIGGLLLAPKSGLELRGDLADATRKGIDRSRETAQQLGERAGEYYESTRERAGELYSQAATKASDIYSQASEKVGEVAQTARETATRKTGAIEAAVDAGKKAYQEGKRETELAGKVEPAASYEEKAN